LYLARIDSYRDKQQRAYWQLEVLEALVALFLYIIEISVFFGINLIEISVFFGGGEGYQPIYTFF
jgi:hypothetical protein